MKHLWKIFHVLCWIGLAAVAGFIEGCCLVSREVAKYGATEEVTQLGNNSIKIHTALRKLKGGA